jgi:predicted RNase H-like HicB family nuclease
MMGLMRHAPKGAVQVNVRATWDPEALVWYATSEDVPGLATEAETQEELIVKLKVMIPELLELNGFGDCDPEVPRELLIYSQRREALGC